ncbi:transferase family protein [Xylariomycetidae sp. FL2044]|nr:transferase family protein [Xylariomycetidae sp. FL2044]
MTAQAKIIGCHRVFPAGKETQGQNPTTTPLSILDASVAHFSPTGAIWFYESLPINEPDQGRQEALIERLHRSLPETLNHFPQWAGQLKWADYRPDGRYFERFNRPIITYGDASDPGVEWKVVEHPFTLGSVIPSPSERAPSHAPVWRGDAFPQDAFISQTQLALHNLKDYAGLSSVLIQLNLFECGGYAIGVKVVHPLADAQSLMMFMDKWATISQKNHGRQPTSLMPSPVFAPRELDARAAGPLDGKTADPALSAKARALPLHRYDRWDIDGGPNDMSKPPADILDQSVVSPVTRAPWETWDFTRPISYSVIHFPGSKLEQMKATARRAVGATPGTSSSNISRLDALLAHIFRLVNQSRGLESDDEEVFLNVSLDARRRVDPPLPPSHIGSPLFLTHMKATGREACGAPVGTLAGRLRKTMSLFDADALAAMLHDAAHEVSPQRLWGAFLGSRHILVTSWLRLPLYELDFEGSGRRPRFVHQVLPKCDGLVQVMDAPIGDGGVDVALYLDSEVMEKLLVSIAR